MQHLIRIELLLEKLRLLSLNQENNKLHSLYFLELETILVVLPSGEIIKTGSRTKKSSAGYNLTNLFIGSEGTLGIITEVQLRLSPIPESILSAVCYFPDLDSAVLTSQEVIQYGVNIARIEMLNKDQMEISIKYSKLDNIKALSLIHI